MHASSRASTDIHDTFFLPLTPPTRNRPFSHSYALVPSFPQHPHGVTTKNKCESPIERNKSYDKSKLKILASFEFGTEENAFGT